jgi:hypothetical protein
MKTLLFLLCLGGAWNASGQYNYVNDSFKNDSLKCIMTNLYKSGEMLNRYHTQQSTGLIVIATGVGIGGIVSLMGSSVSGSDTKIAAGFVGLMGLTGTIIIIDARKYLKRSSLYLKQAGGEVGFGLTF